MTLKNSCVRELACHCRLEICAKEQGHDNATIRSARRNGLERMVLMTENENMKTSDEERKRITAALEKMIARAAIDPWFKKPNPAFDGSTPLHVIERGDADRLWRMIYELESGEPG